MITVLKERKPCINRESKSLDLTIYLYSCHDINMKFLAVRLFIRLNTFPVKNVISDKISPKAIVVRTTLDCKKD